MPEEQRHEVVTVEVTRVTADGAQGECVLRQAARAHGGLVMPAQTSQLGTRSPIILLRLCAFGTYLCETVQWDARDLGDMSQKHIDATLYLVYAYQNTKKKYPLSYMHYRCIPNWADVVKGQHVHIQLFFKINCNTLPSILCWRVTR